MSRPRGGVLEPTIFAVVGIAILCGLGLWQLDRKTWKENLIAAMTERLAREPSDLPPRDHWSKLTPEHDEFARVGFPAEFLPGQEAYVYSAGSAFRPDLQGPGYWVFAPVRLAGGSIVVLNRGFVPVDGRNRIERVKGSIDIVGVMRWPETRGMFTPADEPQNSVWYLRDIKAIAATKNWATVAPFYVDMESPAPPGGLPSPGKLQVNLPDNHLQYAITWFGLALALAGVYLVWLVRRVRRHY